MKKNKIRWQPEHSLTITYWSITLAFLFLSLSFILERASVHWKSIVFMVIFLVLAYRGYQRRIIFFKAGLKIYYARLKKVDYISFAEIVQIIITGNHLKIQTREKDFLFTLNKKSILHFYHLLPRQIKVIKTE